MDVQKLKTMLEEDVSEGLLPFLHRGNHRNDRLWFDRSVEKLRVVCDAYNLHLMQTQPTAAGCCFPNTINSVWAISVV
jgi:hypothetical protein